MAAPRTRLLFTRLPDYWEASEGAVRSSHPVKLECPLRTTAYAASLCAVCTVKELKVVILVNGKNKVASVDCIFTYPLVV